MDTHHSDYGTLKSVLIKHATDAFISQEVLHKQWKVLNFLEEPEFSLAQQEYEAFEKMIIDSGTLVLRFPNDESVTIDSIYCRDASIATDFGMIICHMGKAARKPEAQASMKAYLNNNIPILGIIQPPGTVEGGDVAWLNNHTLAVGRTYRTNDEGIHQLRALLEPHGITVCVADMPHYKGPDDVFHLMSVFSPVDKDLAVVYSPLMPIRFREELLNRGYQLIEVPDSEWDSMGCNVLALAPRKCLVVSGNSITRQRLLDAGCQVLEYEGREISLKGGGGPTCLTRPLLREI
ncbi:MAG: arginine deiminase family protein [Cyclobacteriaceae bacterium]|jgi:N-dimethylarginine dimethylaminohydrolase|nr:arginine deiminase family protein [Cyclobacteriaceae bacterium]